MASEALPAGPPADGCERACRRSWRPYRSPPARGRRGPTRRRVGRPAGRRAWSPMIRSGLCLQSSHMSGDPLAIERAMVVHAHPDDAEFIAGATIPKLAADGVEWTLVIATSGNRGGEGDRSEGELVDVRVQE